MINTVVGPLACKDMGFTVTHEHILWGWVGEVREKHSREKVIETMLPPLKELRALGCKTFIEQTPYGAGRDVLLLKELAELTGLNIVTNCGVWDGLDFHGKYVPPELKTLDYQEMAAIWEAEFFEGIEGGEIKPGFIKLAVGDDGYLTTFHKTALKAAVKTSKTTGLPIHTHLCSSISARETVKFLEEENFPLQRFTWTHADHDYDLETIIHLMKKGI